MIDVQKGYVEKYDAGLVERINRRVSEAIEHQELIIYVKNIKKLRHGMKINELAENLHICSSCIVCKEAASAFSNDELHNILKQNQVTEMEIIGIDGNSCIASTATDAQGHGYKVVLPGEYIGVQNSERFEKRKISLAGKGITII